MQSIALSNWSDDYWFCQSRYDEVPESGLNPCVCNLGFGTYACHDAGHIHECCQSRGSQARALYKGLMCELESLISP